MQLIDHVSITVHDIESAKRFYKAVMTTLGAVIAYERDDAIGFGERNQPHDDLHTYISVLQSDRAISDPRRHCCFRAQSVEQVRAFHNAGLASGGADEGAPGIRAHYHPSYFAAFLLDPEGNKVEAVFHHAEA